MIADLDTLLIALYVELTDRIIPLLGFARSGPGQRPEVTTSGVGLSADRARALADTGIEHVRLSLQAATPAAADRIAGARAHDRKLDAAAAVQAAGMVLTVNVVLHRGNTAHVAALAASLGADRLELAHAQYYGWALRNRASLLPTAEQVRQTDAMVHAARAGEDRLSEVISKK